MTRTNHRARASDRLISRVLDARSGRPDGRDALDRHLDRHPDDRDIADELDRLWDDLGCLPAPPLRLSPAEECADTGREAVVLRSWRWAVPVAMAASVALVAALWLQPVVKSPAATPEQHFAAAAQSRKLALADGSIVTLAARSAITVQLRPERRVLRLERGEAYFQVAPDKARPFVVATAHGDTTAVGTAFDIKLDTDRAVVTVTEGTVHVTAPGGDTGRYVTRGQQLPYRTDPQKRRVLLGPIAQVDDRGAIDWTTGVLRFEGTPLAEVVAEVNRHSARQLRLVDPALAGLPIFAILKVGEVDGLLALVAAQQKLDPARMRQTLRIEGSS